MGEAVRRPPRRAVHIVDDDAHMRRAIWFMLESAGYAPRVFADGEDLLAELDYLPLAPLLCDMSMPGMDGFEVLAEVKRRAPAVPVIMMTGHGDVPFAVRAMKGGVIDFIEKPFRNDVLLEAVEAAAAMLAETVEQDQMMIDAVRRMADLTARERDVLDGLAAGKSNKVIAFDLGLSIRTIEMHRVRMMRRLGARTLPEALRLAHLASGVVSPPRAGSLACVRARRPARAA